jgi:hypothetical protein
MALALLEQGKAPGMSPWQQQIGKLDVPASLRQSHDEIRAGLVRATTEPGRIGDAAMQLAKLCLPHFEHEEKCVFPVLGLLPCITTGEVGNDMAASVLPLIVRYCDRHEIYRKQHESIACAVDALLQAAHRESNREIAEVAYFLKVHEKLEDDLVHPAILMIGKYLGQDFRIQ